MLKRVCLLMVIGLSTACVGPTGGTTASTGVPPGAGDSVNPDTVTTTLETTVAESYVWPTVVASDFIHAPSGPVGGVRTSDLGDFFIEVDGAPTSDFASCRGCLLTVLDDGRVLKVGQYRGKTDLGQIWDPTTGSWSTVGRANGQWGKPDGHARPAGLLLDDGRVLVVGFLRYFGPTGLDVETIVQVFDPDTGTFDLISTLRDAPDRSPAIELSDGRVLIASSGRGGFIYDPLDDSFTGTGEASLTSKMAVPPEGLVALPDGRALLVEWSALTIYDPTTDQFRGVGEIYPLTSSYLPTRLATTVLKDGRVLLTGGVLDNGSTGGKRLADAVVFDPVSETVTPVGPMLEPRAGHSAVALSDGRVVIIGGGAGDRVEIFDPSTETFQAAPALSRPRDGASVAALQDGNLLVVGGVEEWGNPSYFDWTTTRTAEVYHPDGPPSFASGGRLTGFTLRLLVDDLHLFPPGSGRPSARILVPPGGLDGATRARLGSIQFEQGTTGTFWEQDDFHHCEMGCEIKESLPRLDLRYAFVVDLHIEYRGEIPAKAAGITLSVEAVAGQ